MGASQSVSGHLAHREGWGHRLKRVASNETRKPCGMCLQPAELGEPAYSCRGCTFVLHEACYRLRKEMAHFGHSCKGFPLMLTEGSTVSSAGRSCSICAVPLDGGFVYGCGECRRFYAHPRCCGLPQTLHNPLHPEHSLTLLPPPTSEDHGKGRSRRCCVNKEGKCSNAKRLDSAAWSYQCNRCLHVELCLACQLPGGGGGARQQHGAGKVEAMEAVGQQVASVMGTIVRAFCCSLCLGGGAQGQGGPIYK